jgi:hypothetical protein
VIGESYDVEQDNPDSKFDPMIVLFRRKSRINERVHIHNDSSSTRASLKRLEGWQDGELYPSTALGLSGPNDAIPRTFVSVN